MAWAVRWLWSQSRRAGIGSGRNAAWLRAHGVEVYAYGEETTPKARAAGAASETSSRGELSFPGRLSVG